MELGIQRGVAAYRWGAWAWMAAVVLLSRHGFARPVIAYALVGAALLATMAMTAMLGTDPARLQRPFWLGVELELGAALVLADGWVYEPGRAYSAQSIGVAWPLAGVLAAAVAGGPWFGVFAGLLLGIANLGSNVVNGISSFTDAQIVSMTSTAVLFALAGGVAGHVRGLLASAEREVAAARAREEVAQTLHDGVLQTLAVIERRADDPALARLARDQERDLRAWLAAGHGRTAGLDAALRQAAARFEDAFGGRVRIVIPPDLTEPGDERVRALAGAVGEALTNAGKHGGARTVTVFAEPVDGALFCSVKDDGDGFQPGDVAEGVGLTRSIRGRIAEVGGRVEVDGNPGRGTEVRCWVPA